MDFQLTTTAFEQGEPIPREYTADGKNLSPPVKWSEPPEGTKSIALVCEDPDAPRGIFIHWVIFNLPAESRELAEGIPPQPTLPNGTVQGANDFGNIGYGGPAPPPGKPHRYFFRLYAVDRLLELKAGGSVGDLRTAIRGHTLADAELMGTHGR